MSATRKSTTEVGNTFRDAVASLLRTKYPDVRTEVLIGHKKVDVVYTYVDFGRRITVGVECKNEAAPLTKDDIRTEIWSDYEQLVTNRDLDFVIIVARKDINAMARVYVEGRPSLRFQTFEQFEDSLIGLNDYVAQLAGTFKASDLESYYVEARLDGHDAPALDVVQDWMRSDDPMPLAILGGYGKGKTSLAMRVVSEQAARHRADPAERIPILIRLGHVVHETQLEALFGKEFTARYPATDFRFSTLMHLNAEGRLLIVLDGFDEMKHAMSVADFNATFKEFNRLLQPKAKVLLLGRPNALPTEARTHVLRGLRRVGNQLLADPQFAPWDEKEISFFNDAEIEKFLRAYLDHLLRSHTLVAGVDKHQFIEARVREIISKVSADLLRRPVQARIVADLAHDPNFTLDGFTKYTLYDAFIKQLIARDTVEKRARSLIPMEPRYSFQQELAWWSWTKASEGQGYFNRDEIPQTLVERLPDGGAPDGITKLNEYIVSSLTEEKEAGVLYFEHRSFQEFLVADRLRTVQLTPDQHVIMSEAITSDIRSFLDAAPDQSHLARWFETLSACKGPLDVEYLRYFQSDASLVREVPAAIRSRSCSPAHVALVGLAHEERADWPLSKVDSINLLAYAVVHHEDEASSLAALCLLRIGYSEDTAAIQAFFAALLTRIAQRVREINDVDKTLTVEAHRYGPLEELLNRCMRKTSNVRDGVVVFIHVQRASVILYQSLTSKYLKAVDDAILMSYITPFISEVGASPRQDDSERSLPAARIIEAIKGKDLRESVERILRARSENFSVVPVNERARRYPKSKRQVVKI